MSFVSGLGTSNYTIPAQRYTNSSATSSSTSDSPAADFLSLNDSTVQGSAANITSVANQQSADSQQSEQDREEAFAKLMVTLQNPNAAQASTATSTDSTDSNALAAVSGTSATGTTGSSSTDATQDFQDYMSLSPAQKMRYSALQSMGLNEDSLKSLPADQQTKINDKIADIIKKQTEAQANASGTTAAATTASANASGSGSGSDSTGPSFLTKALSQLTQSATDATANLGFA